MPLQREFARGRAAAERRLSAATVRRCRLRGRTLSTADALALASAQADPTSVGQRLTVRQVEVTALVADGLTNREIAAELQLYGTDGRDARQQRAHPAQLAPPRAIGGLVP